MALLALVAAAQEETDGTSSRLYAGESLPLGLVSLRDDPAERFDAAADSLRQVPSGVVAISGSSRGTLRRSEGSHLDAPPLAALRSAFDTPPFTLGYLTVRDDPHTAARFLDAVLPCEGGISWYGDHRGPYVEGHPSGYISRAQFHPGTWRTILRTLDEALDPLSPYDVGRATAVWIDLIGAESIDTSAGWPVCGRE